MLTVTDRFSGYVRFFPIPNATAACVASTMIHKVFMEHSVPHTILCDGGNEFKAEFQRMCKHYKISQRRSSPYYPECNGGAERAHTHLNAVMRAYPPGRP